MLDPKLGRIVFLSHDSKVLANNPWGDASDRQLAIFLPKQYDSVRYKQRRFPVLFELAAYTNSGLGRVGWQGFEESVPERIGRLINNRKMSPCIVAFPDCFTSLGGTQYINSAAVGDYGDYVVRELVPFVDREFRTLASPEHRGCFGKSSGGYGALMQAMLFPGTRGAVASHAGDAYFDFTYRSLWPEVLTHLQHFRPARAKPNRQGQESSDDGRVANFLNYCRTAGDTRLSGSDITALMLLCMAATYDPDPDAPNGFRLPFDLHSGELLPQHWRRWQKFDPVNAVEKRASHLRKLKLLYLDCGWRDQYHIHFGARQLSQRLHQLSINHVYQEFDGTHSGIDCRLDVSLPKLSKALA